MGRQERREKGEGSQGCRSVWSGGIGYFSAPQKVNTVTHRDEASAYPKSWSTMNRRRVGEPRVNTFPRLCTAQEDACKLASDNITTSRRVWSRFQIQSLREDETGGSDRTILLGVRIELALLAGGRHRECLEFPCSMRFLHRMRHAWTHTSKGNLSPIRLPSAQSPHPYPLFEP